MTFRGHVSNGVVILDGAPILPDGLCVTVAIIEEPSVDAGDVIPTLHERLQPLVGRANGLPGDASVNLDHYLYGAPKQE